MKENVDLLNICYWDFDPASWVHGIRNTAFDSELYSSAFLTNDSWYLLRAIKKRRKAPKEIKSRADFVTFPY